MGLQHKILELK